MAAIAVSGGGAVWWTFTRWMQVWCVCSVKTVCDPYLSASKVSFSRWGSIQIYCLSLFWCFQGRWVTSFSVGGITTDKPPHRQRTVSETSKVSRWGNPHTITLQYGCRRFKGHVYSRQFRGATSLRGHFVCLLHLSLSTVWDVADIAKSVSSVCCHERRLRRRSTMHDIFQPTITFVF